MTEPEISPGTRVRMMLLFQVKLVADAVRDLFLSPIAIAAMIMDLGSKPDKADHFERLMKLGRESDRWINLFNQHDEEEDAGHNLDQLASDVETRLKRTYKSGEVVKRLRSTRGKMRRDRHAGTSAPGTEYREEDPGMPDSGRD